MSDMAAADYERFAHAALPHYGLDAATVTLLSYSENGTFLVESGNERQVLRVHRPGYHSLAAIALPQYRNYTQRSANGACMAEAKAWMNTSVADAADGRRPAPGSRRADGCSSASCGSLSRHARMQLRSTL